MGENRAIAINMFNLCLSFVAKKAELSHVPPPRVVNGQECMSEWQLRVNATDRLAELYSRQEVQLSLKEQQEAHHRIKHIYRYRSIFVHSPNWLGDTTFSNYTFSCSQRHSSDVVFVRE